MNQRANKHHMREPPAIPLNQTSFFTRLMLVRCYRWQKSYPKCKLGSLEVGITDVLFDFHLSHHSLEQKSYPKCNHYTAQLLFFFTWATSLEVGFSGRVDKGTCLGVSWWDRQGKAQEVQAAAKFRGWRLKSKKSDLVPGVPPIKASLEQKSKHLVIICYPFEFLLWQYWEWPWHNVPGAAKQL